MVTEKEVERILENNFSLTGDWQLNAQGLVDVAGSVSLRKTHEQIPVAFGKVTGIFEAVSAGLRTLQNAPQEVSLSFKVGDNLITSLAHAPKIVGSDFEANGNPYLTTLDCAYTQIHGDLDLNDCGLQNMNGCPQVRLGFWLKANPKLKDLKGITPCEYIYIDYDPDLALLPALVINEINLRNISKHFPDRPEAVSEIRNIIKKYEGKGKAGLLNCALELKHAGFGGNAKW